MKSLHSMNENKEIGKYILRQQSSNPILKDFIQYRLKRIYDLSKSLNAFSELSFNELKEEILDEVNAFWFIFENDKCICIIGRKPEAETDEDTWLEPHILKTSNQSFTSVKNFLKSNTSSYKFYKIGWENSKEAPKSKYSNASKGFAERDFQKRKEIRNEKVLTIKYYKAISKVFNNFDNLSIDDKQGCINWIETKIREMNRILESGGLTKSLQSIDVKITDWEFDDKRNVLYAEFRCPYSYIEDNSIKTERYASIMTHTLSAQTLKKTLSKHEVLMNIMLQTLTGFAMTFSRLFIDSRDAMNLSNFSHRLSRSDVDTYMKNVLPYSDYIIK